MSSPSYKKKREESGDNNSWSLDYEAPVDKKKKLEIQNTSILP